MNMKTCQEFAAKFRNENYHSLADVSSCSLHIVHGAFRTSAEKSEWALKKLLKGAYMILHNTPARRKDCESVTGSSTYHRRFFPTPYKLFGLSLIVWISHLSIQFSI